MSEGFKVWNLLHNEFVMHNPHVAGACFTAGLFVAGSLVYRATTPKQKVTSEGLASAVEEDLVPTGNFNIRNITESLSEYVRDRAHDIIGDHYTTYLPLLIFVFLWLLVNNLMGLIPGFGSPTDNVNTTLSMGVFIFLYYNIQGFRSHGLHYLEQFTGHLQGWLLFAIGWMMFPLELISHMVRPITLGVRLRTNIFADHAVFDTISTLTHSFSEFLGDKGGAIGAAAGHLFAALAPVPIMLLGVLVCVIQALVFTLLSSVYISLATAHEEH